MVSGPSNHDQALKRRSSLYLCVGVSVSRSRVKSGCAQGRKKLTDGAAAGLAIRADCSFSGPSPMDWPGRLRGWHEWLWY